MTTSRSNDSPDESAAVAAVAPEGGGEAQREAEPAAAAAERILTSAPPPGRYAVPPALADPEAEPEVPEHREEGPETAEAEREATSESLGVSASAAGLAAKAAGPEADAAGSAKSAAEPPAEAEAAERATAESAAKGAAEAAADQRAASTADSSAVADDTSGGSDDAARTAAKTAPGRPHKSLLAGAAIVGALLISVPFLVSGGDGDDAQSSAKPGATPGTMLEGLAVGAVPGVVGSKSPSPHASTGKGGTQPKVITTTGPDGKPITVTVTPKAGSSDDGKKPSGGTKPASAQTGPGKTSAGSGSGSGGTSGQTSSNTNTNTNTNTSSGSSSSSGSGTSGSTSNNTTQSTQSSAFTGGVQIYGYASNRCIGVANSPNAPTGSKLVIWDCYNESYQRWKFVDGTVRSEGKCMNVAGGATNNGAGINWTTCNGSKAQQFRLNSSHDLTNPQSGNKCVDVRDESTANGATLQLWTCGGTPNQKWGTRTP
ncbi:ricin-type beta-trefoil lectin domain protein [Streptomyces sp. NPDC002690]